MVQLCPEGWTVRDYFEYCERVNRYEREREKAMKVVDERIVEQTIQPGLFSSDDDQLVREVFI